MDMPKDVRIEMERAAVYGMAKDAMSSYSEIVEAMDFGAKAAEWALARTPGEDIDGIGKQAVQSDYALSFIEVLSSIFAVWADDNGFYDGRDAPSFGQDEERGRFVEEMGGDAMRDTLVYVAACAYLGDTVLRNQLALVDMLSEVTEFEKASDGSMGPLEFAERMREFRESMEGV